MFSNSLFGKKYLDIQQRQVKVRLYDEDHVVVKVHACGVCGTDINFAKDWSGDPMPLGHEIAAEVMEIGKNVNNVKVGDRVIVEDCTMCGICVDCKSGNPQYCRNMYNMENQSGMGQYMSVRYNCLNKFDGMDYVDASLTEPLAVAITAVLNADIPLGGSVIVLGCGPIGLMAARLAKLRGAGFVAVTGLAAACPREEARFRLAKDFGCDLIIDTDKKSVKDEIQTRFPQGIDRAIVTAPPQSMYDALKIIRFGGLITFLGLHFGGKNIINVDVNDLIFRKITLRPTFAEPANNFPIAIKLLRCQRQK
jgi:L-iditol 2-dehydrogenase